jgi:hypothetical protein
MITARPFAVLLISLIGLSLSAWVGATRFNGLRARVAAVKDEFGLIQGATLTLLGLIIGFTFSMAIGRYDQRKNCEEEEANAIGTEYVRADFLPPADGAKVRALLKSYLDQRVLFYTARDAKQLERIEASTAKLQSELWSAVKSPALAQPTPLAALVAAGMNDVLNSQGYAQAAWWNRIPAGAWVLMITIATFCNLLVGYGAGGRRGYFLLILPLALSVTLFLIADIDSPRHGAIQVQGRNLESTAAAMAAP